MPDEDVRKIFPKNQITDYYIDLVRLRPKLSTEIPGEHLKLKCKISKAAAKDDYMFNVACNSSYGYTLDKDKIDKTWNMKEIELKKNENLGVDDIEYMKKDWYNLDAKRIFILDSFDFTIQSVGIFTPYELVKKACKYIYEDFERFKTSLLDVPINKSDNTMENSYDIYLYEKDHTFGKCLEYLLYRNFYEGDKKLSYCGFQKRHPHDNYCIIRLAYKANIEQDTILKDLNAACEGCIDVYKNIEQLFIE
jgi:DNA-directed RNA polymerase subunit L